MMRRHNADNNLGFPDGLLIAGSRMSGFGNGTARKKSVIHAPFPNRFANFFLMRPELHLMRSFAPQRDAKRRAPCSRADDGNLAHARFDPRRLSVPAKIRLIF